MSAKEEKEFLERMAKHVPLRRTPRPEDIAAAAVHLLSSPATTGTILEVDGGRHLGKAVYG
jgi:NAD(P)-dependent dehydrogenase (short-subunit alcohol dehydrogenase family)